MNFGCCHGDSSHGVELLQAIDIGGVTCLNEAIPGSCINVFKAACSRDDRSKWLDSAEGDADLMLNIPFTSTIQLRSVCVSGGDIPHSPARVRLFVNRPDLDFGAAADAAAAQELTLRADPSGDIWHAVRAARFNNVSSLQLFFSGNLGSDDSHAVRINWLGLRAEVSGRRVGVVHASYESQAQLADHAAAETLREKSMSL
jgi:hypothetical protein